MKYPKNRVLWTLKRFFILLMLCTMMASEGFTQCRQSDSLQLVALYNATGGANWYNKSNWLSSNPIETWYGVILNAQGCVDTLMLGWNGLRGNLPDLNFMALRELWLQYNSLTGSIPNLNLPNLIRLQLNNNQLTGSLPNFGVPNYNLSNLLILDLGGNQLTGNIPTLYAYYLQFLILSNNRFTGSIPDLSFSLPRLRQLAVSNNQLTGNFPALNSYLRWIDLDGNQLTGAIPTLNSNMGHVKIQSNRFTFGDMLTVLSNLSAATTRIYAPQDSIFTTTTYSKYTGDAFAIDLGIDASVTTNVYKWYKNGTPYQTNIGNNKLIFNNLQTTDAGIYTCEVTNSNVSGLTLYSRKATLNVALSCRTIDSLVLVDLYNSTGGPSWNIRLNWLSANPINTWYGITTNAQGCVTCIDLDGSASCDARVSGLGGGNNLTGTLPSTLNNLSNLNYLFLSENHLSGSIPNLYLSSLRGLYLGNNLFSGNIPPFAMFSLNYLFLNNNQLTGCIPTSLRTNCPNISNGAASIANNPNLATQSWTNYWNNGEGACRPVNSGGTITAMQCGNRNYVLPSGRIVNAVGVYPDTIHHTGVTPDTAYIIDLRSDISCRCTDSLALVDLYNATGGASWTNRWTLTQPMTNWYGIRLNAQGCVTCIDLDGNVNCNSNTAVGGNNLVGTLPISLSNLLNLQGLYLANNQLSSNIPNFNLPNLRELFLGGNQLSGGIPNFNLPNLRWLYLGHNQLNGSIPDFNLPNLTTLGLQENQLSGSIPNFNLPNLTQLILYHNQLSGNIPNFNLLNLQYLWLHYNQLNGSIPNFNFPALISIALSSNQLSGNIPNFNFPQLQSLELHSNQLTGSIPNLNLPNLQRLYLQQNRLSGSIPVSFQNLRNLEMLHYYSNKIDSMPDLSMLPLKKDTFYLRGLYSYRNKLTFAHILPNMGFATSATFVYAPQDSIYIDTTMRKQTGETLTINLGIDGAITTNKYKWYKNSILFDSTTVNKLIINNLQLSQSGIYTCEVTNLNAPLLTLYSRKITVSVTCVPPVTNQSFNIVQGDSLRVNDTTLRTAGTYRQVIHRQNACDSIVITVLNVINPCAPLPSGAIARYDLDGNAQDLSGNAYHGTVSGATLTNDRYNRANRASFLDGIDDYIELNYTQTNISSYSISCWVNTLDSGCIFQNRGTSATQGTSGTLVLRGNGIGYYMDADCRIIGQHCSINNVSNGQWHHIVGTWSSSNGSLIEARQFKIYVDGVLTQSIPYDFNCSVIVNRFAPISGALKSLIGYHPIWNSHYKGKIDDILMYNRALTEAEIVNLYGHSPNPERTVDTTILAGTNYVFNNHVYNEGGTYRDTIPNPVGCDSIIITNLSLRPQPCAPIPTNGLVLAGGFNGNANDESGNGNHGTVNGATLTTDRHGKPNRAYLFNGIDNYINFESPASLNMSTEMTMELWFKVIGNAAAGRHAILMNKEGEYECAIFNDGTLRWAFGTQVGFWDWVNTNYVVNNQWNHLAITFNRNTVKTYLNGVKIHTNVGTPLNLVDADVAQNQFRIGNRQNSNQPFNGLIDDIHLYNRALTEVEIVNLYGHAPPIEVRQDRTICTGKSVTVGRHTYTMTGVYTDTLQTIVNQCDSVVTTHLTVTPPSVSTQSLRILEGQSVTIHGRILTQAGTYRDTFWVDSCKQIDVTILSVVQPCASGLSTTGLIAYYPFNGNARDMSGNEHHGTASGATLTTDRFNQPNSAYDCNGINHSIQTANFTDTLRQATISAWAYLRRTNGGVNLQLIMVPNGGTHLMQLEYRSDSSAAFNAVATAGVYSASKTVTIGSWHHITGVYDGSTQKIFVNGQLVASAAASGSIILSNQPFIFGKQAMPECCFWDGKIDDIAIYNRALTTTEIQQLYQNRLITWTKDTTICAGKSLVVNEHRYDSTGIYRDTFRTVQYGCDSVIQITNLTVPPRPTYDRYYSLLEGGSLQLGNRTIRVAGIYPDTIRVTGGCDTIRRNIVAVLDPCASNISTQGLVAYYDFKNNANDKSGNGNHGTIYRATPTTDRNNHPNNAYNYNGVDNYIQIPNDSSISRIGDSLTLSAWFLSTDVNGYASILCKSNNINSLQYRIQIGRLSPTVIGISYINLGKDYIFNYLIESNKWYHIVVVQKRLNVKMYINDTLVGDKNTHDNALLFPYTNTDPLMIGMDKHGALEYHQGKIDDIAIYNRPLTATEVHQLYQNRLITWTKDTTICAGKSLVVNEHRYDSTGIYRDTFRTVQYGCDSVIQITNLTVPPRPTYDRYYSLLEGGSLQLGNRTIRVAGIYPDTIRVTGGCDTIRRNIVAVLDPCASNMPTNGLIIYEDCGGNANDRSGYGNHGTVHGATLTTDRYGNPNKAYYFNGINNYIEIANATPLSGFNDLTLSAWVYKTSGQTDSDLTGIVTKWYQLGATAETRNQDTWAMYAKNDKTFCYTSNSVTGGLAANLAAERWVHIVFIHKSNVGGAIYIDGNLAATNAFTGRIAASLNPVLIGADRNGVNIWRHFKGKIDEIAVYNRALDTTEIRQLYNNARPVESTQNITICSGQSVTVGDTTYRTTGNYRKIIKTVQYQCDSVVNTQLIVTPPIRFEQYFTIRPGQTILKNGHTISQPSVFEDRFQTAAGCDSIVKTTVAMLDHCANELNTNDLIFYMPADGNANDLSGNGNHGTVTNAVLTKDRFNHPNRAYQFTNSSISCPVDSLFSVRKELTLSAWIAVEGAGDNNPRIIAVGPAGTSGQYYGIALATTSNNRQVASISHSFSSNQRIPTNSNWYHVAMTFKNGLIKSYINGTYDNQATLNFSEIAPFTQALLQIGYSDNGLDRFNGKIDDLFIFKRALADSEITALYQMYPVIQRRKDTTVCGGQSIWVGNRRHDTTGSYVDTLQTVEHQCDSVVTTRLTVLPIRRDTLRNIAFCEGDSVIINGVTIKIGGVTHQTLPAYDGCDSFLTIYARVKPKKTYTFRHQMCQGQTYVFGGRTLTTQDIYTHPFHTFEDCDSLVTLNLIVIPPVYKTRYDTICEGQSITIGRNIYNQTGTFTQTLPSFQQCDSILTTHLTVHPVMRRSYDAPICAGDSVWTGRRWLKTAGTSSDTFRTWRGCDSIVTITVIVKPILRVTQSPILCSGRGITVGDSTYYVSGTYTNTLQSVQYQCDSIVTTILTIVPPIRHIVRQTICANESFQINDSTYRIAGLYRDTIWHLRGENSCDTALEIQLTVLPLRFGQQRLPLCQDDSLRLHDRTITQPGTYRDTLPKIRFGLPCDSVVETVVYPLRKDSTYEFFTSCHARDVGLVIDSSTLNPAGCKRYIFKRTTLDPTDVVTISGNEGFCEGRFTTLSVPSGFRYAWSTGVPSDTFRQIQAYRTGDYTVTITNNFGCKSTATKYVFTNPLPQAAIVGTSAFCANNQQVLTAVARFCRFQWSTGATSDTIQPNRTDTYTVIATDLNGCKDTATHFVRVHPLPNFKIDGKPYFCEGTQTDLTVAAVNPTPPLVQYLWSTNATTPKIKVWQQGNYDVTVKSDSGCLLTQRIVVRGYQTIQELDPKTVSICPDTYHTFPNGDTTSKPGFFVNHIKWNGVECDSLYKVYNILIRPREPKDSLVDWKREPHSDTIIYRPRITNFGCDDIIKIKYIFQLDKWFYTYIIYEGLIPKGTPENDYFIIPHITHPRLQPNHLYIADKRGMLVYDMENYDNKWSGTDAQGNPLPEGSYHYLIKVGQDYRYQRSGTILINYGN